MKNRIILAAAFVLLGLLILLIPTVILPVCESEMKMACFFTKKAEIGVGAVIAALGVVYVFLKNKDIRVGISLAQIGNAILALALPLKLTGLCKMSDMACRVKTLPGLVVVSVLLGVVALGNSLFLIRSEKES